MKIEESKTLFEKSREYFPGGVNSPVRAFGSVGGVPVFVKRASGSHIFDEDGNEYIDYVNSWGPSILGHACGPVVEAVREACLDGLSFGAPTRKELVLGTLIRECMPSMEMMRMVSSGTEAVMSAIRAARGYTGRDKIVKFIGCYHGHSDGLLVKAGSGALTESAPDSAGVPASYTQHTLLARYNDEDSVKKLFSEFPDDIGALVVEPVAANMGLVPPKPGFLEFLREITAKYGAVLIFDEVITGFRMGLGGAQGYYGVTPDMTALGKIAGGGMPMGVYGGRKEIMEVVSPLGKVYQAGTLSGNPIATTAGIATIRTLMEQPGIYSSLEEKAGKLVKTLKETLPETWVNQAGSLFSVFFTKGQVVDFDTALASDTVKYGTYFHYLLEHGIYTAPSQFEILFLSAAHTDEDIEKTCSIIKDAAGIIS
ncbi:glutamate-1-semialdehyde 2,1-aminomutase [Lacrimispora sphenoides]|jgi:glutamate-1-semialdehyde 2,1-aminomutase|uniref:glutamate-1-semialdehyde 2,1-aminomutase n=1 Tax=Lacrimispora sphenoides TaxID=29370 RepID=UPI0008D7BE9C|nr:glutamate-1-semialdehyde 2,1-aminomutase [Lacrimispora sphenoides]SEU02841.1 glutamate-1-semialdehyde 2,1-aminomutase [Lacrimispora sphenoides]